MNICDVCGIELEVPFASQCPRCYEGRMMMGFAPPRVRIRSINPPTRWIGQVAPSVSGGIIRQRPGARDGRYGDVEFPKEPEPVEEPLKDHRRIEFP